MAHRAEALGICGPDHGGEKPQRVRPALVVQGAMLHLTGQHLGMLRQGGSGVAQGFARQG